MIQVVQAKGSGPNNGNFTLAFDNPVTAGNTIIVVYDENGTDTISVSDNLNGSYTQPTAARNVHAVSGSFGGGAQTSLAYKENVAAGTTTVSVVQNPGASWQGFGIIEATPCTWLSGAASGAPTESSSGVTGPTITSVPGGALAVAAYDNASAGFSGASSPLNPSGWTQLYTGGAGGAWGEGQYATNVSGSVVAQWLNPGNWSGSVLSVNLGIFKQTGSPSVAESLTLSDSVVVHSNRQMIGETLALDDNATLAPQIYLTNVSDSLSLSDAISSSTGHNQIYLRSISESLSLGDSVTSSVFHPPPSGGMLHEAGFWAV